MSKFKGYDKIVDNNIVKNTDLSKRFDMIDDKIKHFENRIKSREDKYKQDKDFQLSTERNFKD